MWLVRRLLRDARELQRRAAKRAARRAAKHVTRREASVTVLPESSRMPIGRPPEPFPQTFICESFFIRELITMLTPGANEEMHFLTGPKLGPIRIVCRWAAPARLDNQSPVFVRASARSVADVLIPIIEQGAELHMIAHSHPGAGAWATTPSGTDIDCLGKLQKNGSPAIGCIVTRDGHVRFFSVQTKFHVMVLGNGVKEVSQNVFRIAYQDNH
jgi:proteasome lid subunit RPN8/RPN11